MISDPTYSKVCQAIKELTATVRSLEQVVGVGAAGWSLEDPQVDELTGWAAIEKAYRVNDLLTNLIAEWSSNVLVPKAYRQHEEAIGKLDKQCNLEIAADERAEGPLY